MEYVSLLAELRVRRSAPAHLNYQIKKGIEELITSGKIPPGTRMPSVQQIADACGVSLNTAKFAVRELARDGFLIPRAGLGTFVAEKSRPPPKYSSAMFSPRPVLPPGRFTGRLTRDWLKAIAISPDGS